ncbi:MAG: STAS domain-containing protein [Bacteroidota bacterium]
MEIKENFHSTYITLMPIGELDANSSVILDERIAQLLETGTVNIHIDGSGISYINSPGLGVVISYVDELAAQGGKFVFSDLSDNVADVFSILGLDRLDHLIIVNDPTEVEAHFSTS